MSIQSNKTIGFDQWYKKVNVEVMAIMGMGVDDLPDCCYADWFEEGISPNQAARRAIKSAKGEY